jgi:hypothetical protein
MVKVRDISGNVYDFHLEIATHDVNLAWDIFAKIEELMHDLYMKTNVSGRLVQHNFFTLKRGGKDYPTSKEGFSKRVAEEEAEEQRELENEHRICLMKIAELEAKMKRRSN